MIDWSSFKASKGKFLLSEPTLGDVHFSRTVVLVVSHTSEGSTGFILNRPMQLRISDLGPEFELADLALYEGGPVELNTLHYVHTLADLTGAIEVQDGVYWGGDFEELKLRASDFSDATIRFFLGYSGWGAGQLEHEIHQGTWVVAEAHKQAVFYPNADRLWEHLIRSQGGEIAGLANYPQDPSWN